MIRHQVKRVCVSSVTSDPATTWTAACQPPLSMGCPLVHGKNTGVGCHILSPVLDLSALKSLGCLLQGIFPTQGLNAHLLHWQVDPLTQAPSKKKWADGRQTLLPSPIVKAPWLAGPASFPLREGWASRCLHLLLGRRERRVAKYRWVRDDGCY